MTFTVYGTPVAKGRPKLSTRGGFARAYTPEKTANYEHLVKLYYTEECIGICGENIFHNGELSVEVRFYFPIPKSTSKKAHQKMLEGEIGHTKKPDIDNCLKSLFDALNGVAWNDDSQIIKVTASKHYSDEPRTEVSIKEAHT